MMAAPTLKRKKKKRRRSLVLKYWCLPPVLGCVAMIGWLATGPQWSRARILRPWGKPVAGYVADTRKLTQEYRNFYGKALNNAEIERGFETLEPGHPARPLLLDLQRAAQRCVWKASGLLNYSARRGSPPVNASMERLILESTEPALR